MMAHALNTALLHFVWQGAVAAALLWAMLAALRNRSANARYLAGCVILAALTAAPVITAWQAYRRPVPVRAAEGVVLAMGAAAATAIPSLPATNWLARVQASVLPLWAFGVLVCSLRLLWGCREVSLLRRRAEPAPDSFNELVDKLSRRLGVGRRVRVMLSALADGPSVVGWLKPMILLPAATVIGLTPDQLEAIVAHELAHIRRYDYAVNILQMLVEAVFFYHPAVWWISRRIRHERELCCDDIAVEFCGDAVGYARALTALARIQLRPALALGAQDGPLAYRVKRLLGIAPRECGPSRISALIGIALAVAYFGLDSRFARAQAVRDQPGVTVDLHGSQVLQRDPVRYPPAAQSKASQGNITVEVTLDENGNVTDAHVLGGPQEFRKTVLQSVLGWHFAPDAGGSTRQVSVDFQKPPAVPAAAAPEPARLAAGGRPVDCYTVLVPQNILVPQNNGTDLFLTLDCTAGIRAALVNTLPVPLRRATDPFSMAVDRAGAFEQGTTYVVRETPGGINILREEELRAKIDTLNAHTAKLRQQQSEASEKGAEQLREAISTSAFQASQLQADLDTGRRFTAGPLESIRTDGLSESQRAALLSRLPIHEGEAVTRQTLNAAFRAIYDVDPHYQGALQATPDGKLMFVVTATGNTR